LDGHQTVKNTLSEGMSNLAELYDSHPSCQPLLNNCGDFFATIWDFPLL